MMKPGVQSVPWLWLVGGLFFWCYQAFQLGEESASGPSPIRIFSALLIWSILHALPVLFWLAIRYSLRRLAWRRQQKALPEKWL
jgi:hypothetical protein